MALATVIANFDMGSVQRAGAEHGVAVQNFGHKQGQSGQEETDQGKRGETAEFVVHRRVVQDIILRYFKRVA